MAEGLLTTAQAAARLGVDPSHVRRLILAGALPATKAGRDWLIAPADLLALPERPVGSRGRPRKGRPMTCMGHEELAALILRHGPAAMLGCTPQGGGMVPAALGAGWDLTCWRYEMAPGATLLLRVDGEGRYTAEPRLLVVNAPESERGRWATMMAGWRGDPGVEVSLVMAPSAGEYEPLPWPRVLR